MLSELDKIEPEHKPWWYTVATPDNPLIVGSAIMAELRLIPWMQPKIKDGSILIWQVVSTR